VQGSEFVSGGGDRRQQPSGIDHTCTFRSGFRCREVPHVVRYIRLEGDFHAVVGLLHALLFCIARTYKTMPDTASLFRAVP